MFDRPLACKVVSWSKTDIWPVGGELPSWYGVTVCSCVKVLQNKVPFSGIKFNCRVILRYKAQWLLHKRPYSRFSQNCERRLRVLSYLSVCLSTCNNLAPNGRIVLNLWVSHPLCVNITLFNLYRQVQHALFPSLLRHVSSAWSVYHQVKYNSPPLHFFLIDFYFTWWWTLRAPEIWHIEDWEMRCDLLVGID
jgi:hypothetical protein